MCRSNVSALELLEDMLDNQDGLLQRQFDPRDIGDDWQAKAILNRIYSMIVHPDYIINSSSQDISHNSKEFNFNINAEFDIFIFMVLTHRPSLARLFWIRDSRKRIGNMFQTALLACLICRGLIKLPFVNQHYHLVTSFEHMASEYEELATTVLKRCNARNHERTLSAMNNKFEQCRAWNSVDIIVRAKCVKVVEQCDKLCTEAVKRRFFGQDGLSSCISRLLSSWTAVVVELQSKQSKSRGESKPLDQNQGLNGCSLDSQKFPSKILPQYGLSTSSAKTISRSKAWNLIVCVVLDLIGALQFFSPFLPLPISTVWSSVMASFVYTSHRSAPIALVCLIEESVPIIRFLPSATFSWWCTQSLHGTDETSTLSVTYLPIDYFIVDALSHFVLTCLITTFMLMKESAVTIVMEIAIIVLFLSDEVPDILFAGAKRNSSSLLNVVVCGFQEYWAITGYRMYIV